jgi:hypothetical protein
LIGKWGNLGTFVGKLGAFVTASPPLRPAEWSFGTSLTSPAKQHKLMGASALTSCRWERGGACARAASG